MNIGFAGTPAFAATILDALLASTHDVRVVFTQPGRPAGRGRKIRPGPVEALSTDRGLVVHSPTNLRGVESVLEPLDVLVVAAYGLLLPKRVLAAPRLGCMNVHASLLPRWRGASPIEHAILHGDKTTGVSIMQITPPLDAGPVYQQTSLPLSSKSTTLSVTKQLAQLGADEVIRTLDKAAAGKLEEPRPQVEARASYAPRLSAGAAQIDWRASAQKIERHVRAFHGRGMAFTILQQPAQYVRVRIHEAAVVDGAGAPGQVLTSNPYPVIGCGEAALALQTVQLNIGKGRAMSGADAVNGYADMWRAGTRFENPLVLENA